MLLGRIKSSTRTVLTIVGLTLTALTVSYITSFYSFMVAPIIIALITVVVLILTVIKSFKNGLYILLFLGVFMSFLNRILPSSIPFGVLYDGVIILSFIILLVDSAPNFERWKGLLNPVTAFLCVILSYNLIQAFNPNSVSVTAWLVSLRDHTSFLLYTTCFFAFQHRNFTIQFTKVWLSLAIVVALYGVYQEFFGLTSFEWRWIYEDPRRFGLYFIWGHLRKFSFLSDAAAFGLLMAYGGLVCFIMGFGPFKLKWKLVLMLAAMTMFVSMTFSGTRTANAVVVMGLIFFIILTIRSRRTLFLMTGLILVSGFIFFAPIYTNKNINRIRSTFKTKEDPSMNVRTDTRLMAQVYIRSHPMGGGINTTGDVGARYSPSHILATVQPDSGFLRAGLEQGWIGLVILLSFFFYLCYMGINNYFRVRDSLNKTIALAYLVPFFALSVGQFTQNAIYHRSFLVMIIGTYTILQHLPLFENESKENNLNSTII